jgi:hypothetical protein
MEHVIESLLIVVAYIRRGLCAGALTHVEVTGLEYYGPVYSLRASVPL